MFFEICVHKKYVSKKQKVCYDSLNLLKYVCDQTFIHLSVAGKDASILAVYASFSFVANFRFVNHIVVGGSCNLGRAGGSFKYSNIDFIYPSQAAQTFLRFNC